MKKLNITGIKKEAQERSFLETLIGKEERIAAYVFENNMDSQNVKEILSNILNKAIDKKYNDIADINILTAEILE